MLLLPSAPSIYACISISNRREGKTPSSCLRSCFIYLSFLRPVHLPACFPFPSPGRLSSTFLLHETVSEKGKKKKKGREVLYLSSHLPNKSNGLLINLPKPVVSFLLHSPTGLITLRHRHRHLRRPLGFFFLLAFPPHSKTTQSETQGAFINTDIKTRRQSQSAGRSDPPRKSGRVKYLFN